MFNTVDHSCWVSFQVKRSDFKISSSFFFSLSKSPAHLIQFLQIATKLNQTFTMSSLNHRFKDIQGHGLTCDLGWSFFSKNKYLGSYFARNFQLPNFITTWQWIVLWCPTRSIYCLALWIHRSTIQGHSFWLQFGCSTLLLWKFNK